MRVELFFVKLSPKLYVYFCHTARKRLRKKPIILYSVKLIDFFGGLTWEREGRYRYVVIIKSLFLTNLWNEKSNISIDEFLSHLFLNKSMMIIMMIMIFVFDWQLCL